MSAEDTAAEVDRDIVFDGQAQADGVYVTVTVRVEPRAMYADMHEIGEVVGSRAATTLKFVIEQLNRSVPF